MLCEGSAQRGCAWGLGTNAFLSASPEGAQPTNKRPLGVLKVKFILTVHSLGHFHCESRLWTRVSHGTDVTPSSAPCSLSEAESLGNSLGNCLRFSGFRTNGRWGMDRGLLRINLQPFSHSAIQLCREYALIFSCLSFFFL